MSALVLGVDSSTQSTKVEARRLIDGALIASGSAPHVATTPPVSEQDPASWWSALVQCCHQLGDARSDVVAISVAGQQHGLVLVDDAGMVVRPAKLWNDTTSAPEAADLVARLSANRWATTVGSVPVASFSISKLAWVARHEPESLARTAKVMLPHDYLTWRLCGAHVTDRGDASGTGWFCAVDGSYRPDLLDTTGLEGSTWLPRLPAVLGPTDTAGGLTIAAAGELGLGRDVIVGPGTGDNMSAALGLGLAAGDIVISLGTSGVVYAVSEIPTADESGLVAGFADATGRFLPLACTLNATKVTDTVARWLGTDAVGLGELAMRAEGPCPILVPYFDGERTPNLPDATGHFVGLRNDTTREQLARAAHDGVVCGLLDGLDALASHGVTASGSLRLIGGGARSVAYRQAVADLWGQPVMIPDADETVATGAAVQAAAVFSGNPLASFKDRWNLGDGHLVAPSANADGRAVREGYAQAATAAAVAETVGK